MREVNRIRVTLIAGVSMIGLVGSTAATAQAVNTAQNTAQAAGIEEIVVTAQRTAQSLQDVPIAVSAFTSEALAKQQINNSSDLQLSLPNITFTKGNFTGSSFTIRGIGDLCVGTTCDSATAIHSNDLPLFGTRLFETEFFDMERIEVLRGPQGTLFGRNATAGVVNLITAKPDLRAFHAAAEGDYGNYNSVRLKGMINVPLTQTLGVRLAGSYLRRDGYTQNLYNNTRIDGRDQYAIRGSLRWQPDPATTIDLMGYYFHERDDRMRAQKQLCQRDPSGVLGCLPNQLLNQTTNANSTLASVLSSKEFLGNPAIFGAAAPALGPLALGSIYGPDAFGGTINPSDPRKVYTQFTPTYFSDEVQIQAKIEHDFGAVKAKLSGQYQRNSVDSQQDYNNAIQNSALFIPGLTAFNAYANGALGPAFAQLKPAQLALIPNGPNGPYCTSKPSDTNIGSFGGNSVCFSNPTNFDRSDTRSETYTAEGIISSQLDGKFNFLLGGIWNRATARNTDYYVDAFALDYVSALLGLANTLGAQAVNPAFPNSYEASQYYRNNTSYFRLTSYGLFGEGYLNISDKVKLTVGLRYNHDDKLVSARTTLYTDTKSLNTGLVDALGRPVVVSNTTAVLIPYGSTAFTQAFNYAGLDFDPTVAGNQPFQVNQVGFSRVTGRAVLDWKITDRNLLYASYSRGYKSGGINPPLSPIFAVATTFTPETIDAFEIGSKNTFLDGTLRLNLTGFYYKYKGLQLSRIVARTSVNDNVDANIWGLEMDAIIQPSREITINLGASYLHTEVNQDKFLANPRDPSGGRSDAVIIKDITNTSNCAVVPTTAGNVVGVNTYVGAVNSGLGLQAPAPFAANSGINGATGAFSICDALAVTAANPPAPLRALFGVPTGALPFVVERAGVPVNIRGNQLPQSPNFKASAGIQYNAELPGGMSIVPRFDLIFTGNSFGSIFNGAGPGQTAFANRIPSYTVMNAQIQLNGRDDRWFLRAYIQNLANNSAITGQYVTDQSSGLFTNIFTLEPRRYGVAAGFKF